MNKINYLFILFLLFFINNAISQCNGRYTNEVFSNVDVSTTNYSDVFFDNEHQMDIYTPVGDSILNRPLILYFHGGSFTSGDKTTIDCIDFCEFFSKRGFVTASVNYRLSNIVTFFLSSDAQIDAVLRSLSDARSAIRFFKKSYANNNPYGIDTNAIFIAGYSAGGIISIHHAYIDDEQELSPNILSRLSSIGGTLDGDAGNFGYSSKIKGVINFAGGIHDLNWINSNEEAIVSVHGELDMVVNFNCAPALNSPSLLNLCGSNEVHAKADSEGVENELLKFDLINHEWAQFGIANTKFQQALEFSKDFIYNHLPCNQLTGLSNNNISGSVIKYDQTLSKLILFHERLVNNEKVYIYNANGQLMFEFLICKGSEISRLYLSEINSGIYFVLFGERAHKFLKY